MIYFSVQNICLHFSGNKSLEDGLILSDNTFTVSINNDLNHILLSYFLAPFISEEFCQFYHESDLALNEVYTYVSKIFDNQEGLYEQSVNLAKHLYEQSTHPKIKGGEFYTVYFKDCILDGETLDAVGLFKTENKDTFLKVLHESR